MLFYMHPWCALAQTSTVSIQGNRQTIRDVGGFCVDSNPPLWFAQRHMLAGSSDSPTPLTCSAKYVPGGERMVLQTTQPRRSSTVAQYVCAD